MHGGFVSMSLVNPLQAWQLIFYCKEVMRMRRTQLYLGFVKTEFWIFNCESANYGIFA